MKTIKIAAVGDIAFVGRYNLDDGPDPLERAAEMFSRHDLVIANLESPLTDHGQSVSGKCTLRGKPKWASRLQQAGIQVLSLANNHLMDHGPEGLLDTIDNLNEAGIHWLGAGQNLREACAPLFMEVGGQKIALIARTSVFVASPSYAGDNTPGVARFDFNETLSTLKACRSSADKVILLLHWGLEHYRYPTPTQRILARQLVEAGADFIIGHHPHVLQGSENIGNGAVAYSLGNFLFDDFVWRFINQDGNLQDQPIRLTTRHRQSVILTVESGKSGSAPFGFIPTRIDEDTVIAEDETSQRRTEMQRLSRPFKWPLYGLFWRLHAMERELNLRVLPLVRGKFTMAKIKKIRPRHFTQLLKILRRSAGITREKSSNPYE